MLVEKRPEKARKTIKHILYTNANEAAQAILEEKGIDRKSNSLYNKFKKLIPRLTPNTANDGILVWYMNNRLSYRYGPVKTREPEELLQSQKYLEQIVSDLRKMI
ncbi:hypothetical protein [Vallitalea pronyensis]|uniref:hypothetical protein n=1 Tax=Vallitalea pronyensis TaxID=1348613 RepID=UPI001BB01049|nr:hypothetical protein [Vallitalea pronyensis]